MRQACQVENDPHLITAYLTFLAERTSAIDKVESLTNEQLTDMVLDMAQLIVERSTVMAAVLPVSTDTVTVFNIALNSLVNIFYTFLCRVSVCLIKIKQILKVLLTFRLENLVARTILGQKIKIKFLLLGLVVRNALCIF